jgi:hypothetical protein
METNRVNGRRLAVRDGEWQTPELPGDYVGPVFHDGHWCVFFLKPNARDPDAPKRARSVHHVTSPPHSFHEEPDGTLTIRNSIGDKAGPGSESDGWHGYLEKGVWRKV